MHHRMTKRNKLRMGIRQNAAMPCKLACIALIFAAHTTQADEPTRDLTLEQAQTTALQNSPTLLSVKARLEQASQRLQQARSAYWPTISATGEGEHVELSERSTAQGLPGSTLSRSQDSFRISLMAGWTLFDGFLRDAEVAIARHAESEMSATLADAQRLLSLAVARAYYRALLARENVRIAGSDLTFNARLLEDARAMRAAGRGALSDELNFQIRMNDTRNALIAQQAQLETARTVLAALMGSENAAMDANLKLAELALDTSELMELPAVDQEIEKALLNRPDLERSSIGIARAGAELRRAQAAYWPSVRLIGGVIADRPDDPAFGDDDIGYIVGVTLTYDVFDGGRRRAGQNAAQARIDEAQALARDTHIEIASEVRRRVEEISAAQQQTKLQTDNLALVRRVRDMVAEEYRAGKSSLVRLNEAQRDFSSAEAQLALARVRLRLAKAELAAATGLQGGMKARHSIMRK